MNITIDLPQDLEQRLESHLGDFSQRVLEAIAVEAYCTQLITAAEVQRMLNLPSRLATDAFLKAHQAYLHYTEADFDQDLQAIHQAIGNHDHNL